jgi:hypothetical protein
MVSQRYLLASAWVFISKVTVAANQYGMSKFVCKLSFLWNSLVEDRTENIIP